MDNERIRVGIIGPGWWSEVMYVPALRDHPNAELVAVYGRDRARTEAFARANDIDRVYTDVEELCGSGEVDAVIVATSNRTHHRFTLSALDAGLHVLCEKPLAMDVAEADEMAARAEATGRICHVPFTYRWMPTSRWVKRLLDEGWIGTPRHLNLRYYTGYARGDEYLWRLDRGEAGDAGVLGDIGSHFVDLARWFFGEVEAVTCVTSHHIARGPRPDGVAYEQLDDGGTIILEFAGGAQGVVTVSAVCVEPSPFGQSHHFDLHGSDGTLYALNDWNRIQRVQGAKAGDAELRDLPIPDDIWGDGVRRTPVADTYRDTFRSTDALTRGWLRAIADGRPFPPDFATGAAVQRVIAAADRSAREARRVTLAEIG